MSRYGNYDMDNLYGNIVDCGLELDDVIEIFGDVIQSLVREHNDNLDNYKWKVESVLTRISKYPEDIRDKSFISIKELEELIK